jgi:ATP-dependent DNA helicase RecG
MKVVVGKVSEKIFALLTDTPNLNIAQLAEELSVSSRTVERNLKKLQEQGMLERGGGKKIGSWKVLVKK